MKTNNYIILGLLALGFMACEMRDELKKLPSKEDQQEEVRGIKRNAIN